jgi:hypothetical protein
MSDTSSYSATIEVEPASGSATLYQWLSQDNSLQKSTHNSFETYYQNNQAVIKHPYKDSWLSLSIPKTDPAKTYGPLSTINLTKWLDTATDLSLTTSPCNTSKCIKLTLSNQPHATYEFIINSDTRLLHQYRLLTPDYAVTVDYEFSPVILSLPNPIEPFTIPEKPTSDDLELIQALYGS